MTWLNNGEFASAWAHATWPDFAQPAAPQRQIALLPVFGFADHGLGLAIDAEEVAGSEIVHRALLRMAGVVPVRVLPPLRFGPAPYAATCFGIDPETAHTLLLEIAASVKLAGFRKLLFLATSPWQEELVRTASVDARAEHELRTYVITLPGLGLDFHPRSATRAHLQSIVAHLLGTAPRPARPGSVVDPGFRPGRWDQPPPVEPQAGLDPEALVDAAAVQLARLLADIDAHPVERTSAPRAAVPLPAAPARRRPDALRVWPRHRVRYLAALTREDIEGLSKAHALAVIPTGAIEQHGHHLPVGVDALLGQALLDAALPQLPAGTPVWIAPPITYGKSNEHLGFPGTVSIGAGTLRRLLLALARQLRTFGFRHLAVLNTHGGNSTVLVTTLREIQTTFDLRAGLITNAFRPPLSEQEARFGFHAGEWETSLMLAAAPDLVRMERAVCEYPARHDDPGQLRPEDAPAVFSWLTRDISASGVMGDATAATVEKGREWLAAASAGLAARLVELTKPEGTEGTQRT